MPATTPTSDAQPCDQSAIWADPKPSPDTPATAPAVSEATLLVEGQRFAIVPEWVIDADISDSAFRLYALLLRYGNTTGQRMPARPTLARRLHRSVDAIDRAMRQLVAAGMVRVEHRHAGNQYLSNRYHLRTSSPFAAAVPVRVPASDAADGRRSAATSAALPSGHPGPAAAAGRNTAATPGHTPAARVAADPRPDPEVLTQSTPPPAVGACPAKASAPKVRLADARLLAECGITDIDDLSRRCSAARTALGQPTGRWTPQCLILAIRMAVSNRGWPPAHVVPALMAVAADKATRSPIRLAEAGPWWDTPGTGAGRNDAGDEAETQVSEARLADLGGRRVTVQAQARAELAREGMPLTKSTVVRRAVQILDRTPEPA